MGRSIKAEVEKFNVNEGCVGRGLCGEVAQEIAPHASFYPPRPCTTLVFEAAGCSARGDASLAGCS